MTENKSSTVAIVIGIVALVCCLCVLMAGIGGYAYSVFAQTESLTDIPGFTPEDISPSVEPEMTRPPVDSVSS